MDSKLLSALAGLDKLYSLAGDLEGRKDSTQFATTTDLLDPMGLRRVRTTTADKGALASHDYAMRSLPCPFWDPPMPSIGMALTLANFDGNPHDQVYDGVMVNAANPPFTKVDPINDDWRRIPGTSTLEVGKAWTVTIGEGWTVTAQEDATLTSEQVLTIEGAGGKIVIDANGNITLSCTGKVKIGSKEVAVVGAVDSAGQPLVTSGQ
ncbi:MAG: hypothetical protein EBZ77_03555 [Chitinophagia bacterium]|nr:hypothetical protein [Chitinophagia bacterium]